MKEKEKEEEDIVEEVDCRKCTECGQMVPIAPGVEHHHKFKCRDCDFIWED